MQREPLKQKTEEKKERVETVTLSTTARAKARSARKKEEQDGDEGDQGDGGDDKAKEGEDGGEKEKEDGNTSAEDKAKEEPQKDPPTHRLSNPARMTLAQRQYVAFDPDQRYTPVHNNVTGIMMLSDATPDEQDDELQNVETPAATSADEEEEADCPEPFDWTPPDSADKDKNA